MARRRHTLGSEYISTKGAGPLICRTDLFFFADLPKSLLERDPFATSYMEFGACDSELFSGLGLHACSPQVASLDWVSGEQAPEDKKMA